MSIFKKPQSREGKLEIYNCKFPISPPFGFALVLLAGAVATGCTRGSAPSAGARGRTAAHEALAGDVLLQDVAATLNRLPQYINTQLRPPKVILDASTSRDGKTVMAAVGDNPRQPGDQNNYLFCTSHNSRFRRLDVRPGDRARLYVLRDEYGKQDFIELVVAEVFDEYSLRIAGALPNPVPRPERLEIWRYADERIVEILTRLRQYTDRQAALGWEPSPDEAVLEQMIDRLNQWARDQEPSKSWQPDPLTAALAEPLQEHVEPRDLEALDFQPYEARLLQEAVWLRDISQWAKHDALDDLGVAKNLFDWTVRNIQLTTREELDGRYYRPWQTLIYGRGTAGARAWIFALLARQQGLDVVLLAYPDPEKPDELKTWLPALLSRGQLYLFDSRLGLPIPGPEGKGVATLAQVRADDGLLRRLDLDAEHRYPVEAGDLDKVVALAVASPLALSRRAGLFENQLSGDNRVALACHPSALADALKATGQIAEVRLWELPFQTRGEQLSRDKRGRHAAANEFQVYAWRPRLWKARVLHFHGDFDGEQSAKTDYRAMRPSDAEIESAPRSDMEKRFIRQAKLDASYWLGLLAFDNREYNVAFDFLLNRTLKATPDGPWTRGARYNLGRVYEAQGKTDAAVEQYRAAGGPQAHGNLLRARWLEEEE